MKKLYDKFAEDIFSLTQDKLASIPSEEMDALISKRLSSPPSSIGEAILPNINDKALDSIHSPWIDALGSGALGISLGAGLGGIAGEMAGEYGRLQKVMHPLSSFKNDPMATLFSKMTPLKGGLAGAISLGLLGAGLGYRLKDTDNLRMAKGLKSSGDPELIRYDAQLHPIKDIIKAFK